MSCCFSLNKVSSEESNMEQGQFEILEAPHPQETELLLQELKRLKLSEELHKCLQNVADDYKKNPNMSDYNLKKLMKVMIKEEIKAKASSSFLPKLPSIHWPKPSVKVYSVVAGRTFGADKEILKKINVKECEKVSDCDVVVVFCPVTSRVGSDVEDAMRTLPGGANEKKLILVVMHHLREADSQTTVRLNLPTVSKEVHVLYHETKKGLIQCERNDEALQELHDFYKNFET